MTFNLWEKQRLNVIYINIIDLYNDLLKHYLPMLVKNTNLFISLFTKLLIEIYRKVK